MTFFLRASRFLLLPVFALSCMMPPAFSAEPAPPTTAKPKTAPKSKVAAQKKTVKKPAAKAKKTPRKKTAAAAAALAVPVVTNFTERKEWDDIMVFIDEMVTKNNFDKATLISLFTQVRYSERAANLVKPAPPSGKPKDWQSYRARVVDPVRIQAGKTFWQAYAPALTRAEEKYGVPAEVIVAIIGVETRYGSYTGNFRVVDVLSTLAFDYPQASNRTARMQFFRSELEQALLLSRESDMDPLSLMGSYAGAIGLPQFMPGSIRAYAVDFDGDNKIDLLNSPVDAIGSVAHFLLKHGWTRNAPTIFPAKLPEDPADDQWKSFLGRGLQARASIDDLEGARISSTEKLPTDIRFGLIDLPNATLATEYWIVTNNFYAVTQYNRSYFYAMSVIDFSHALRAAYQQ